ncbi:hypothetical protein GS500_22920 [Rhodococcus hoagii]|nr:hypothetical protein [Prescottella equi]
MRCQCLEDRWIEVGLVCSGLPRHGQRAALDAFASFDVLRGLVDDLGPVQVVLGDRDARFADLECVDLGDGLPVQRCLVGLPELGEQ